jgi:MFS family permease
MVVQRAEWRADERSMFRSLRTRNYRLYFAGQLISIAGTFMQTVAQSWLVLELTGSGTALGLVNTLQYGPILLFGGMAGVVVDRVDRRRLFLCTQTLGGLEALALGLLVITGRAEVWMVYLLAATLGIITAVDQTVRQTLIVDMVSEDDLTNALSLNLALGSTSRAVGPALAGITIAVVGIGYCFLINAASFVAVIAALLLMRPGELRTSVRQGRSPGQFRAGLTYVRETPELASILLFIALVFALAWEFEVALPLMARFTFHGDAATYGVLSAAVGVGAVFGGLDSARRAEPTRKVLAVSGTIFAAAMWCATFAPVVAVAVPALVVVGASGIAFMSVSSSRLQLRTAHHMRGRVVALWVMAVIGTRVIGGPIIGWVGEHAGPRFALGLGALAVTVVLPIWYAHAPANVSAVDSATT